MRSTIDFDGIAAAALQRADSLVEQWLPGGKRVGHEWICGSLGGEPGRRSWSCRVNLNTGAWADFAGTERGRDLVSLYAAIHGIGNGQAARDLAEQFGMSQADAPRPQRARVAPAEPDDSADRWTDAGPWPEDGPPAPVAHVVRGRPDATWTYCDTDGRVTGYVHRFTTSDGGKEILPCVWSRHPTKGAAWKWRQWDVPRPLYNLKRLRRCDSLRVLIVEGEKCADAAQSVLGPTWWVTTWSGGGNAVQKADFTPLAGAWVLLWPDCDAKLDKATKTLLPEEKQPGVKAMERAAQILLELGCKVQIVAIPRPGDRPDGWDVADLVAEAGDGASEAVHQWLDPARQRRPRAASGAGNGPPMPPGGDTGAPPPGPDDEGGWADALIYAKRGELVPHLANITLILRHDERWKGVVAFDEFSTRVVKRAPPPYGHGRVGEWESDDDTRCAAWLAQQYRLIVSSAQVGEAIEMVARENAVHPVREYLQGLTWDRTPRIATWLIDHAGVEDTEYTRLVSQFFLRGMVWRVMQPGCKHDYCLVLEGEEGLRKSSLGRLLAGSWFSDTDLDLTHKDSMSALQGKWLHEFAEMDSVTRAEAAKQKSFLSRQIDEFRPVYGRRSISCPRQCVFVGTTNEDEYIKEGQGARRFWPLQVTREIDTDALRQIRDQLFAEAMVDYRAGKPFAPDSETQRSMFRPVQSRRVIQESMIDALHDWVLEPGHDEAMKRQTNDGAFSLADAALRGLHLTAAQLTRDLQIRIGKALSALGCKRIEKRNGMSRYWYKPPARNGATSDVADRPVHNPFEDGHVDI